MGDVVRQGLDKPAASAFIRRESAKLPEPGERAHFATLTETGLTSLHEGNFARYRVRPAESSLRGRKLGVKARARAPSHSAPFLAQNVIDQHRL